ncbi:uncharacterized protein LOC110842244 [Folsomia candida]|uniref:uncharacterized protein LOC110842244 n=1 Tax=Folsomia candida TaxID=158441 RepID=UPI000B9056A9|nr:uncharacterized protein LOC110842244 [Folsomia candida]
MNSRTSFISLLIVALIVSAISFPQDSKMVSIGDVDSSKPSPLVPSLRKARYFYPGYGGYYGGYGGYPGGYYPGGGFGLSQSNAAASASASSGSSGLGIYG